MTCPICKEHGARRSRRQSVADYALSAFGDYPWRCRACHTRFHARLMPLSDTFHAHCPVCGNLELKRISPEHVHSALAWSGGCSACRRCAANPAGTNTSRSCLCVRCSQRKSRCALLPRIDWTFPLSFARSVQVRLPLGSRVISFGAVV